MARNTYAPVGKGVWTRRRNPARLSAAASSRNRHPFRMKGLSAYPGGTCLIDPEDRDGSAVPDDNGRGY